MGRSAEASNSSHRPRWTGRRFLRLAAALGLLGLAFATGAKAEIQPAGEPAAQARPAAAPPAQPGPMTEVQCFQDGKKIIDELRPEPLAVGTEGRMIWTTPDDTGFAVVSRETTVCVLKKQGSRPARRQ